MRAVTAVCENGNAVASLRENGDDFIIVLYPFKKKKKKKKNFYQI